MSNIPSRQHTIKNTVHLSGVGLHSGKSATISLYSAPIHSGIIFRRTDLSPPKEIKICHDKMSESPLCSKLVEEDVSIQTVEHLLSALAGKEIDNIVIELNSDEIPVMDGSASPFVFLFESAGVLEQDAPRQVLRIKKTIRIEEGDKFVALSPFDHYRLEVSIDFDHPSIHHQKIDFDFSVSAYSKQVSRARTFGMADQLEGLRQKGLALGASLKNAVGLSKEGVMNAEGLRAPDEFVRHKLLDAIGDLYVAGPIEGLYQAHKASHAMNNRLLRALFSDSSAWEWAPNLS
ncbi:MAG: UDP-3-O-acyl-N-acetylglucosamine deacetylase [Gammaproteobacteria bacterium]|jgi:UDP-3-O-[3-hydroxymyristoyl] N-acetylglucosamine deacetylase|nr:UDP-3-O-acyl-N-acetylglucosamine deacetylase [Gammaproteobacteria bacterium]